MSEPLDMSPLHAVIAVWNARATSPLAKELAAVFRSHGIEPPPPFLVNIIEAADKLP